MNRIFDPLKEDHPLVKNGKKCPFCERKFFAHQRRTLLSVNAEMPSTVQAVPAHAQCAFRGVKTSKGIIMYVKDGDGSPFPIVMDDGKQYKGEEVM